MEQPEVIEADPNAEDDFLDTGSLESETRSLTSSMYAHVYENGRRYHSYRAGQYLLPDDEMEQDRLDNMHALFCLRLGGALCASELSNPQKILDVGTGTGIWAIEMGDMYPSAVIIGTDLSPIQPVWLPPNVQFEIDDARDEWTFPQESFDFIHARCLGGSIQDWPKFLKECYKHIKPGGQIEISEARVNLFCDDGTYPETCYTKQYYNELHRLANVININFDILPEVPQMMEKVGFTDIRQLDKRVPIGTWPKDPVLKQMGRITRMQFLDPDLDVLSGYSLALFTRNGWTELECQILYAHVKNEIRTNSMHAYIYFSYVMARKPKT